jgi:signal peptidase I
MAQDETKAAKSATKKDGGLVETVKTLVYAVLIAFGIRSIAYEPFNIPSESMLPTLLVGDFLFVSKFTYGYSRHSLPFSVPLIPGPGRLFERLPERGDVAVFKLPSDNSTDYIKRVIGLPGDRVQMRGGALFLNDLEVRRRKVEDFPTRGVFGQSMRVAQYEETLPNGRTYRTLDLEPRSSTDNTGVFTVPPGHVFAMGDNRDNSLDSRVSPGEGGVGFIPVVNLVGRADILFFSTEAELLKPWTWFTKLRWSRLFNLVR